MNQWMTGAVAATLVFSFATAAPAKTKVREPELKDPVMARNLSIGAPILLYLGGGAIAGAAMAATGNSSSPAVNALLMGTFVAMPLSFGTGYFYAGDPLRGTLVGLGGAGLMGGSLLAHQLAGGDGFAFILVGAPLLILSTFGYGLWVAHDVYRNTERFNVEAYRRAGLRPPQQLQPLKPGDEVD